MVREAGRVLWRLSGQVKHRVPVRGFGMANSGNASEQCFMVVPSKKAAKPAGAIAKDTFLLPRITTNETRLPGYS